MEEHISYWTIKKLSCIKIIHFVSLCDALLSLAKVFVVFVVKFF